MLRELEMGENIKERVDRIFFAIFLSKIEFALFSDLPRFPRWSLPRHSWLWSCLHRCWMAQWSKWAGRFSLTFFFFITFWSITLGEFYALYHIWRKKTLKIKISAPENLASSSREGLASSPGTNPNPIEPHHSRFGRNSHSTDDNGQGWSRSRQNPAWQWHPYTEQCSHSAAGNQEDSGSWR